MPEPEATPEFQATADLSPFSPSPLHSAAPAIVPVLQDTADILDAMSTATATNGIAHGGVGAPAPAEPESYMFAAEADADADAEADDDDSLNDAYREDEENTGANNVQEQQVEPDAGEDDYLKIFDSPPGGTEEDSAEQDDVSQAREFMHNSAASDSLTSPPQVAPPVADFSSARPAAREPISEETTPSTTAAAQQGADAAAAATVTAVATATAASSTARDDHVPEDDHAVDISRLVAEMTGQASEADAIQSTASSSTPNHDAQSSSNLASSASATLPPRPPLPQQTGHTHPAEDYRVFQQQNIGQVSSSAVAPPTPGQPSTYVAAGAPGAPGTTPHIYGSLPPPPATGLNAPIPITSMTAPPYPNNAGFQPNQQNDTTDRQKLWDTFIADERRYMADAKWDKFPDGSRIFIGNLSSERVSKRDVFDIFHQYGRLAQISLKSAYGFVQYHNLEDAQAAMDNLQGTEIKGRKIHLEFSRAQKKKDGNERNRSPDRGRGGRQSGRQDRHESGNQNHDNRRNRDDYRPGRNSPPRRSNGYSRDENNHSRDRHHYDSHDRSRGRSRSPNGHGRQHDGYRRRSPSPPNSYGRGTAHEDRLDIPRRYGSQVPDVQFLLLQELSRDFVGWVERAFTDRGLKVDVMFLHPSFPREQIVQRQAVEGVHAIVDLDMQAHNYGKISLRVFDRSAGVSARYDDYRELDPPIAAELVLRAKSQAVTYQGTPHLQAAPPSHQPYQGYGQPYGGHQPHQTHPPTYAQGPPRGPPPSVPPAINAADLASVMNGIDNATLQQLLANMGTPGQAAANTAAGAANAQIQALIGNMQTAPPAPPVQPASYGGQVFPLNGPPTNGHPIAGPGTGDSAAQVQNIMAQLARYRQ